MRQLIMTQFVWSSSFLASKGIYLGYDKPCGELALAENCIEIISDKSNFLGMFLEIQTDIRLKGLEAASFNFNLFNLT